MQVGESILKGSFILIPEWSAYAQMAKFAEQQMDMFSEEEGIPCFCGD